MQNRSPTMSMTRPASHNGSAPRNKTTKTMMKKIEENRRKYASLFGDQQHWIAFLLALFFFFLNWTCCMWFSNIGILLCTSSVVCYPVLNYFFRSCVYSALYLCNFMLYVSTCISVFYCFTHVLLLLLFFLHSPTITTTT